jgi:DNA-binding XRE family transcriptional regulator
VSPWRAGSSPGNPVLLRELPSIRPERPDGTNSVVLPAACSYRRNISTLCSCRNIPALLQCLIMRTSDEPTPARGPFRIYTPASLGDAIRHYRTEAGLTQARLAEMAGLQRSYLSELESGKETEQVKRLFRVLRQLGVRMTLDKADW